MPIAVEVALGGRPRGRSSTRRSAPRSTGPARRADPDPRQHGLASGPAFALVPFFGYAFGPIVGFFTGFVGNAIGDQISGWGPLTSWNWSLANGLVGLIAGLAPLYLAALDQRATSASEAIGGAIAGAIAVVIGFLFIFTDAILQGLDVGTILDDAVHPGRSSATSSATIILVPILVYAWEPVKERLGR